MIKQIHSTDEAEQLYADQSASAMDLLAAAKWVISTKRSLVSFFTKIASFGQNLSDSFTSIEEQIKQIEYSIENTPKGKPSRDNSVTRKQARNILRFLLDHEPDTVTVFQIDKEILVSGAKEEAKFIKQEVVDPVVNAAREPLSALGTVLLVAAGALGVYYLSKKSSSNVNYSEEYDDDEYV